MSTKRELLLDIMLGGRYVCQLKYTKRGFPLILQDGKVTESIDIKDLEDFVVEQKPSLKGKDFRIEFSNQRV